MKIRLFLGIFLLLTAVGLSAQTFRGTILGTVTDPSGAVISGAKVTVRNTATGLERVTQTTSDGTFNVPELPIGSYSVAVSQSGFQTFVANGVAVTVAAEKRVDATLKTGQVAEQVVVSAESLPQVDTTTNELGGTLTAHTIENLPVNGRDYTKLIYLNPGISGSPDQITDSPGSFGEFSMNGSRGRSNNFLLDGTDMNDGYRNDPSINEAGVFGDPATILPIDAVAELRVLSNYEPEYGRNSGAIINIVTKSGTNGLHGTALEYFRSNKLDARNYFNFAPNPKSSFHNNQFGGSLGGPIVKDKTFFFLDYEGQRETGGLNSLNCVPDPAVISATEASIVSGGGTVSPTMTALLNRNPWPVPNIAGAASDASGCTSPNLSTTTNFRNSIDSVIAKIDHNFNARNMLTGRYYFGNSDQSFPLALQGGGVLPGYNTSTPTRVQLVSLSYVKIVNAQQVNEARLGWNRFAEGFFPQDQSFNPASIGMDTGVSAYNFGLPHISVGNFSVLGAAASVPRQRVDQNWHFIDNYSWNRGRHAIKFGYEFRRTTIANIVDTNFRGKLSFDDLKFFLEGIPSGGSQAQGYTNRHGFENSHGFYVQDSFRWTNRLTVNFGTRWDYFGVVGEKNNLFYRFDPVTDSTVQVGTNGISGLYNPDHNNFAPRVSFAYDLTGKGKTVVRAGWGVFYDAFSQDFFLGHLPYNCVFCPGPTYAGIGPAAISFASATSGPIVPGSPVYVSAAPLSDFFAADPNIRTPYTQNWNLNLQQQVASRIVLQIGYVGSKGTKLFRFRDINQPSQAAITAADLASGVSSYGVPRPFPNFFYINQEESTAGSVYHALQTSLRVDNWHGLQSQVNYVWSHAIDNASDGEDFVPNASQPENSLFPGFERANSNFDIRQRFSWNFVYSLPTWKGRYAKLTDGWGFDGVLNLQTGQPFNLNYNFEGDYSGAGEGFDRPDIVAPVQYGGLPGSFLNLASFSVPCTLAGGTADTNCVPGTRHFGTLGRNSLLGPNFRELNFSVFKNTALGERATLQLRAEFFNILNHPNFSSPLLPNFIADPANNGLDATGRGVGFLPLTATGDVGIGNPFLGGGGPRGIQFAAKVSF